MLKPAPPPEARLIRLVREAAGIKTPDAARAARISKARWSQIENGYETRGGDVRAVRATAGTLAHMAAAVGLAPDRLETEAGRTDAAEVLREIQRATPEPPASEPPRYADPREQRIMDLDGFTDEEKRGMIAWVRTVRAMNEDQRRRA